MDSLWTELLEEQEASGFRDVAGAQVLVTLPISDRLVSRVVAQYIPPGAPVREVDVRCHAGNILSIRVRVSRPAWAPAITIRMQIVSQPELPANPVLVLRLLSSAALTSLAGTALRFVDVLPPGIALEGDRLSVDIKKMMRARGLADQLRFLNQLELGADDGRLIVMARGGIPPGD